MEQNNLLRVLSGQKHTGRPGNSLVLVTTPGPNFVTGLNGSNH